MNLYHFLLCILPGFHKTRIKDWVTKDNWALLGVALHSHLGRALVFNEVLHLQQIEVLPKLT
ncbi:MAG: hypothetical protein ACP5K2_05335 [bacterium]